MNFNYLIFFLFFFFFFNDTATTEIYTTYDTLSLHDALPISEQPCVRAMESALPAGPVGHGHLVRLPGVAHLEEPLDRRGTYALALEIALGGPRERAKARLQHALERRHHAQRAAIVPHHLGREHSPGREEPRLARHVDAADAERRRQLGGVQRARAPEGDQREEARIVPALDRDHAQRALHGRVRDPHDAGRCRLDGAAEAARERRDRPLGARAVEAHRAAQELAL